MSEGFENGPPQYYGEPQQNSNNTGMAIASMILGIAAIVVLCWKFPVGMIIGIVAAIVAIVLGVMHNNRNGKHGMAIAGIVCGIVALVLAVILIILMVIGLLALGGAIAYGL